MNPLNFKSRITRVGLVSVFLFTLSGLYTTPVQMGAAPKSLSVPE